MDNFKKDLEDKFSFMSYVPFIFISAKTGQRVDKLFEMIKIVNEHNAMRISTGMLNDVLAYATTRVQPPSDKGQEAENLLYDTALDKAADFCYICKQGGFISLSYQRYIENQIKPLSGLRERLCAL